MDSVLRDFRDDDFETLWSMDQVCFAPGIAYSREELAQFIGQGRSFTLVAESGSNIVGFLVAELRRATGHLITIDVLPRAQRVGVGSKLLVAAEARLRAMTCRRIYLETAVDNAAAIAFYKRHGYFVVRTVPRYYSNGVDALLLEKELLSGAQAS